MEDHLLISGETTIPDTIKLKEWDREFYRTSLDYLLTKAIIGKCLKCQGALRKDGMAGNSYRLKCGACNATTGGSAFNATIEEHFEAIIKDRPEAGGYTRRGPRRQEPVLKTGQRQLPAIKRMAMVKTEESDEEDKEIARGENLMEIMRRLKEAEKAIKERDETISQMRQEIDSLKETVRKRTTEIEVGPKTEPDPKVGETDGSGTKGSKKDSEKKKTPTAAWQGPKPDWVTIGKKGKPAKIIEKPKVEESKGEKKKEMSREEIERFTMGQGPKRKGLKCIYVKGVQRWRYSQLRAILTKLGIQPYWIRHYAMVAKEVLEMIVFEERVEEISQILKEKAPCYEVMLEYDPLEGTKKDLKNAEARLKRQIGRLPSPMHSTRKILDNQLETVRTKLKAWTRTEREKDKDMDMDMTGQKEETTGAKEGTQRTDV